jgi:hypothetical protein
MVGETNLPTCHRMPLVSRFKPRTEESQRLGYPTPAYENFKMLISPV